MRAQVGLFELMNMPPPSRLSVASACTQADLLLSQSLDAARLTTAAPSKMGLYIAGLERATACTMLVKRGRPTTAAKGVRTFEVIVTSMYSMLPFSAPLMGGLCT